MPEIITTPQSLVQTTNGKRFYVFSGVIDVTSSEITMIDINNIGERDIKLHLELGTTSSANSDFILKLKSNGSIVYNGMLNSSSGLYAGNNDYKFILPANTSLVITLQSTSATQEWTVAGHGKYV